LYVAGFYSEAKQQVQAALNHTNNKTIFIYYLSAILFAMNKSKEAILYLEKALSDSQKHLNKFISLNPEILKNHKVAELITHHKKKR